MGNFKKYVIVFLIALLLSLIFIYLDKGGASVKADAVIYTTIAGNLVKGHGFSNSTNFPYLPTMEREPVYPVFLGIIFYLFKSNIFIAQIAQAITYAITCILIFRIIAYICPDKKLSFVSAIAVSSFPTLANYTAHLITEVLFTFLLALIILILIKSLEYNRSKWYFCSGVLIGVATLCRAILMFFCIFFILFISIHYYKKYKRFFAYKLIGNSFVFLLGFLIIIIPWMTRNYIYFKKFEITLRGSGSLYARAAKVNLDREGFKMYAVYSFSEHLAGKLFPGYNLTSTRDGYFYKPILDKIGEINQGHSSKEEIDDIFRKESIGLIKAHPVKFFALGIFEIIKFNSFSQILLLNESSPEDIMKNRLFLPFLRGFFKLLGFFILLFAIKGIVNSYKERYMSLVLFFIIIYFNIIYFFLDSIGRYAVPILPYYIFFCIIGIVKLAGRKKRMGHISV